MACRSGEQRLGTSKVARMASISARPFADVFEKLPFRPAGPSLPVCPRGGVALHGPQRPLNIRRDRPAFLADRPALRGQNLPVFEQVFQLLSDFYDLGVREDRRRILLEVFLERLPLR